VYSGESFIPSRRLYDILSIILMSASVEAQIMSVGSIFFAIQAVQTLDKANKPAWWLPIYKMFALAPQV